MPCDRTANSLLLVDVGLCQFLAANAYFALTNTLAVRSRTLTTKYLLMAFIPSILAVLRRRLNVHQHSEQSGCHPIELYGCAIWLTDSVFMLESTQASDPTSEAQVISRTCVLRAKRKIIRSLFRPFYLCPSDDIIPDKSRFPQMLLYFTRNANHHFTNTAKHCIVNVCDSHKIKDAIMVQSFFYAEIRFVSLFSENNPKLK